MKLPITDLHLGNYPKAPKLEMGTNQTVTRFGDPFWQSKMKRWTFTPTRALFCLEKRGAFPPPSHCSITTLAAPAMATSSFSSSATNLNGNKPSFPARSQPLQPAAPQHVPLTEFIDEHMCRGNGQLLAEKPGPPPLRMMMAENEAAVTGRKVPG